MKTLFDSYLWFCVCGASMHRDFFKLVFNILVVYLHKTHRNVVTFYPSLRFWSVYPPSKCKKVFYPLPFASFCLIFFYFFPTAYLTLTSALPRLTKNTCLLCFQQAGRQTNRRMRSLLRLLALCAAVSLCICYGIDPPRRPHFAIARQPLFIHNQQYNKVK